MLDNTRILETTGPSRLTRGRSRTKEDREGIMRIIKPRDGMGVKREGQDIHKIKGMIPGNK